MVTMSAPGYDLVLGSLRCLGRRVMNFVRDQIICRVPDHLTSASHTIPHRNWGSFTFHRCNMRTFHGPVKAASALYTGLNNRKATFLFNIFYIFIICFCTNSEQVPKNILLVNLLCGWIVNLTLITIQFGLVGAQYSSQVKKVAGGLTSSERHDNQDGLTQFTDPLRNCWHFRSKNVCKSNVITAITFGWTSEISQNLRTFTHTQNNKLFIIQLDDTIHCYKMLQYVTNKIMFLPIFCFDPQVV